MHVDISNVTDPLQTDDVGVFDSPLSNEYLLAAQHFHINRFDLLSMSRGAIATIFGGLAEQRRLYQLMDVFEQSLDRSN